MTAPRRLTDVPAHGPGSDLMTLAERHVQHQLHIDERGRMQLPRDLGPEELVSDGLAVLALGEAMTRRIHESRWSRVADVLRQGATVGDVAAALELDQDEVQAGVRSWADGQQRLQAREGRWGLTPAEADAVRALVDDEPVGTRR